MGAALPRWWVQRYLKTFSIGGSSVTYRVTRLVGLALPQLRVFGSQTSSWLTAVWSKQAGDSHDRCHCGRYDQNCK